MPPHYDVAIIGAGPVGITLTLLLAKRAPHLRVALIDSRSLETCHCDPRVLALSHGSRQILDRAGVWFDSESYSTSHTAIQHIHVSQANYFGSIEIDSCDYSVPALGYVVRYASLMDALDNSLSRLPMFKADTNADIITPQRLISTFPPTPTQGLTYFRPYRLIALRQESQEVFLTIGDQQQEHTKILRASLAIKAEGGLFEHQTIKTYRYDYQQTALVGFVTCTRPRIGWAWERFSAEGPLALLPLEDGYSLVWCRSPEDATRCLHTEDASFLAELHAAFGDRMGDFRTVTGRACFSLGLNALEYVVDGCVAVIGNAAQTLHPVAGQGLNLGLRDAFDLTEAIAIKYDALGACALQNFSRRRRLDRSITIRITDWLPRIFGIDIAPVAVLRGLALLGMELAPPIKAAFVRQMMFGQRR
ncbi:2-octaprenyl-6-methoxyphenol hydroxylase [Candidatus Pandoraea novymonadis]|uniref:2-octaprenyl-6-methoxyphenol hydroxylase n=2 Tax=Candidatus Pandoraea novymonadis TaxID=1808959 RepID=A0ABX5FD87_9BURK|nr:UbiH/UbiF/VisC/COQ6 family ubiquinone biosynthesis hydroxylase [Candidatus Pandoraea novymonadis]PSB91710.1 2-octaprenyl-6-methoxyphenol hydroxylase [Candidatus Pandoraea novymonadis]